MMLSKLSATGRSLALRPLGSSFAPSSTGSRLRSDTVARSLISHPRQQQLLPVLPKASCSSTAACFSTTTSPAPEAASSSKAAAPTPAPVRDFFLDNLGKIFLGTIALVIASLVRSSYGTSNMKRVREEMEEDSALDPMEIDELRRCNADLTPELFRKIMNKLKTKEHPMTYPEFVTEVRTIMLQEKGEGVTVGLGHLLDRVVIKKLKDQLKEEEENSKKEEKGTKTDSDKTSESTSDGFSTEWETQEVGTGGKNGIVQPLSFWLTVLSLALHGPVPDRISILYEILELEKVTPMDSGSSSEEAAVTLEKVREMVGHLQDTCQLVPDKTVVPTETKYPTQQFKKGSPEELVQWEGDGDKEKIDLDAFAGILRSKSVCAWGECYHRKKYVP